MGFKVGDALFDRYGQPGLITNKEKISGDITVDTKKEVMADAHRHGYINGLSLQDREKFNKDMDEVRAMENPKEQVMALRDKIGELNDPKDFRLKRYLHAELSHLMNTHNIKPRYYTMEEHKVPQA